MNAQAVLKRVAPALLAALLLVSCAPREDRSKLARRPVSAAAASGWARLPLDGDAQRAHRDLWLSDVEGTSIPFEVEREGLWQPRQLELAHVLLGRDGKGRPTAEFTLKFPEGWQVRDREHLKVDLELEGKSPWVARVEVDRRMPASAFLRLEQDAPVHLFDLGMPDGKRGFYLPWDAQTYRVALASTQGAAPRITGVRVTASTRPEELRADEALAPAIEFRDDRSWLLKLDATQRIVGAEVMLKPPVAPVQARFDARREDRGKEVYNLPVPTEGLLWNLPALETKASRLALGPALEDRLLLTLPEGAKLDTVKLLVRRDVLLFPAEAGKAYFLHTGGRAKQAPGSLAALPESSRAVYSKEPLQLGPAESDPHGLPILIQGSALTRPWLPWAAGFAVLLLGLFAWKLLKGGDERP